MERLGSYPGNRSGEVIQAEVLKDVRDSWGRIRVNEEKCDSCPFTAGTSFNPQLKRILSELEQNPSFLMQCHKTFPSDVLGAICRGGYDHSVKQNIKRPTFIKQQRSFYTVIPVGK